MKRIRNIMVTIMGMGLASATPAAAATMTLTFDLGTEPGAVMACASSAGGVTDKFCSNGNPIGSDYGSTSSVGVSYLSGTGATNLISNNVGGTGGASAFQAIVDGQRVLNNIILSPGAGFEVALVSFQYYSGSATANVPAFQLLDPSATEIFSATPPSVGFQQRSGSILVNSGYYSGPITFGFGTSGSGAVGIDNVVFDVRATSISGAVPEPATWALMIGGFGCVGGAMRRRTSTLRAIA